MNGFRKLTVHDSWSLSHPFFFFACTCIWSAGCFFLVLFIL